MGVFYQFQRDMRQASYWVEHTWEVRSEIRSTLVRLVNAEAGLRGYLLTGRRAFLDNYKAARKEVADPLNNLRQLVADSPSQTARVSHTSDLIAQTLKAMDSAAMAAQARQSEQVMADVEAAKSAMDQVRTDLAGMQEDEQRLLDVRTAAERRAGRNLEIAIVAGGLLGLMGGIVAAFIFATGIARRIQHLEEDAHRLAKGLPVLTVPSGKDEISGLERALAETSQLLVSQLEQIQAAQHQLESRVEQRTAELQTANEELHKANEVRQAVIQSSPLAIWAVDLEGRVTFWNPAAERIFGWKSAEVIGQPLPVVPADQQAEYAEWLKKFAAGEKISGVERIRAKNDGTRINVVIWTAPLRDAAGHIIGTIAIDSDITERKVLEEQFRQSQKLEAIGRLAGGVAHDFNNLLTVITGYTEMLSTEVKDRPEWLEYTQEIQYAAGRASALTSQLLAFSRRQISQPRLLDLNEVVTHSLKLLRRVIGEDIEIAMHLEPGLGKIKADPIHIDQVIMNLVVNARDAMGGGGKLTIETANRTLDRDYAGKHIGVEPGPYCMLAISDTGTGMNAATRDRLFEPFFTTKEAGKGTGLGLAIVYGVVKQNGGEIMVYSELGKGTTFKIYLPMIEVPEDFSRLETQAAGLTGSETILLTEDEESIRKMVHNMLARLGYQVIDAESPDEAIEIARQSPEPIDLLLTDVVMPRRSGFELAEQIREFRPGLKVLYMSGYADNHLAGNSVLDPNTPFVQKPFSASALTQKIREALAGSVSAQ